MLEVAAVSQAIGSLLLNGGYVPTGTPIEPAPLMEGTVNPAVAYSLVSSKDILGVAGEILMSRMTWQVVAVGDGDTISVVHDLSVAIHRSLHKKSVVNSDGVVYPMLRVRTVHLSSRLSNGKQMQMMGGWYMIDATADYGP